MKEKELQEQVRTGHLTFWDGHGRRIPTGAQTIDADGNISVEITESPVVLEVGVVARNGSVIVRDWVDLSHARYLSPGDAFYVPPLTLS